MNIPASCKNLTPQPKIIFQKNKVPKPKKMRVHRRFSHPRHIQSGGSKWLLVAADRVHSFAISESILLCSLLYLVWVKGNGQPELSARKSPLMTLQGYGLLFGCLAGEHAHCMRFVICPHNSLIIAGI